VLLDGSDSHTHEPGKSIVAWEWTENGNFLSRQEVAVVDFPESNYTRACLAAGADSSRLSGGLRAEDWTGDQLRVLPLIQRRGFLSRYC